MASVPNKPDKVYIGLTEGEWKKRHSGHKTSFKYKKLAKSTALSTYFWEIKEKEKIDPIFNLVRFLKISTSVQQTSQNDVHFVYRKN